MATITISREVGSGGDELAQAVAQQLGWRLVGRALINQAARLAGVPEVALAEIDELGLLGLKPPPAARSAYRDHVQQLILEVARAGQAIIVGRGGQCVLAGRPDVLHIRVHASEERRLAALQERRETTLVAATALLAATDKARAAYLRRYFGCRWDDPHLYSLTINLDHLTIEAATSAVCAAMYALAHISPEVRE